MRKLWLLFFLLITVAGSSQNVFDIKGIVGDTTGQPLSNATVRLYFAKDSSTTTTDKNGLYYFTGVSIDSFSIVASYSGLQSFFQSYTRKNNVPVFTIPPINLNSSYGMMEGIIIKTTVPMLLREE